MTLSNISARNDTGTTADIDVTTDESDGEVYCAIRTAAQGGVYGDNDQEIIKNSTVGNDCVYQGEILAGVVPGVLTFSATGLPLGQERFVGIAHENGTGGAPGIDMVFDGGAAANAIIATSNNKETYIPLENGALVNSAGSTTPMYKDGTWDGSKFVQSANTAGLIGGFDLFCRQLWNDDFLNAHYSADGTDAVAARHATIDDPFGTKKAWSITSAGGNGRLTCASSGTADCTFKIWLRAVSGTGQVAINEPASRVTPSTEDSCVVTVDDVWREYRVYVDKSEAPNTLGTMVIVDLAAGSLNEILIAYPTESPAATAVYSGLQTGSNTYGLRQTPSIPMTTPPNDLPSGVVDGFTWRVSFISDHSSGVILPAVTIGRIENASTTSQYMQFYQTSNAQQFTIATSRGGVLGFSSPNPWAKGDLIEIEIQKRLVGGTDGYITINGGAKEHMRNTANYDGPFSAEMNNMMLSGPIIKSAYFKEGTD